MSQRIPQAEEVDWTRLEGPAGPVRTDDAAHWRSVYRELVATMDRLLESARARHAANGKGKGVSSPDSGEVEQLAARVEYFRRRLKWWSTLEHETEDSA